MATYIINKSKTSKYESFKNGDHDANICNIFLIGQDNEYFILSTVVFESRTCKKNIDLFARWSVHLDFLSGPALCLAWYINIHCLNVDMQLYHACIIKHQNHPNPVNWNSHQARSFIVTARHIVQIWNYMFPNISKRSTQSLTQILWRKVHTFEAKSSIWSWVLT